MKSLFDRADRIRLAVFAAGGFGDSLRAWADAHGAWLVSARELVG